ncbi:MAG: hypothetical protein ACTHLW_21870 [Verrucomicrobiota bacterium]
MLRAIHAASLSRHCLEFDEEEIIAQLVFGERGRIAAQMFMEQAQLT